MAIKKIVTDIEGTTSSISFVHETLFPFSSKHLPAYVEEHFDTPAVQEIKAQMSEHTEVRLQTPAEMIAVLQEWIKQDKKLTPLKKLQGLIWERGYRTGELKGHIYPDAYEGLCRWKEKGIELYVYSSGSVHAQKLLFGHTEYGDLNPMFSGNFDTTTGGKKEKESYASILSSIAGKGTETLFLSDVEAELEAAQQAGLQVALLVRDQKETSNLFQTFTSFEEIDQKYL